MLAENHKYKHDRSNRISDFENEKIINFVQTENGILISVGVIQLYLSRKPHIWQKYATGIICLIKDMSKRSYFFRFYDLYPKLLWEEEIYTNFILNKISDQFYCFPGLNCNVGFNFAFNDEALKFELVVFYSSSTKKIANQVNINQAEKKAIAPTAPKTVKPIAPIGPSFQLGKGDNQKINIYDSFKAQKKLIDKNHIGSPTSFKHVNHIGLSSDNNFEVTLDAQDGDHFFINQILQQLNLKPNRKTLEYANKFMESNGGLQKYIEAYQEQSKMNSSKKEKSSKLKRQSSNSTNGSVKSDISRRAFKKSGSKKLAPKPHALEVVANMQPSFQSQQSYSNSILPSPVSYSVNKFEYQKEENDISSFRNSSPNLNAIPSSKEKNSSINQNETLKSPETKFHSFKLAASQTSHKSLLLNQVSSPTNEPPSIQTLLSTFIPPSPSFNDLQPPYHPSIPSPSPSPPPTTSTLSFTSLETDNKTLKTPFIPPPPPPFIPLPPPPLPVELFSSQSNVLEKKLSNNQANLDQTSSPVFDPIIKTSNRLQRQTSDTSDNRSEFLRSIENFNGKFRRHIENTLDESSGKERHINNNVMNSLLTALDKMRPYLKDSSDEDDENFDEKQQFSQVMKKHF